MRDLTPIVVLGANHSGTTILYRMIAMHPETTWFSQYSQRGGQIPDRRKFPFHQRWERMLRRRFKHKWMKEQRQWRWNLARRYLVPRPAGASPIWKYIFPEDRPLSSRASSSRMQEVFETERAFWDREFLVVKPLNQYRQMDIFKETYPTTKFVHIVRDGRAVALSLRHKYAIDTATTMAALQAAGRSWVREIAHVRSFGKDVFELRYEDFCVDVGGHLKEICRFAGLEVSTFPFDRAPTSLVSTNPRRLLEASESELSMLQELQGEYLTLYEYAGSD